ncbi:MAG TPA: AraC family transcriptional regulator [Polyangiales bacterium]|nr:AraC family transcriptional regulator [Polyangiales bacterium]
MVDALEANGHDAMAALEAAGLSAEALKDPSARHPVPAVARFWEHAVDITSDPAFGLRVPKYTRPTTFHALGYAVLASPTLGEALQRMVRYCQVVTDSGMMKLAHEGDEVVLHVIGSLAHNRGGMAFRDSVMSTIVRGMRMLMRAFTVRSVTLNREPGRDFAPYERFFGCAVTTAEWDTLHFDALQLEQPLPGSNPELARHNDAAVREYLSRVETGTIADRTRTAIAELTTRAVSPELVARKLGMSLRSLQRSLREHGTSYEDLLRDVRRELACAYLREGRYSVTEIAFLLGYDSLSAFARAFKRWTGKPPSAYQQAGP